MSKLNKAIEHIKAMRSSEQIMRDDNRKNGNYIIADVHGDRVQMATDILTYLEKLRLE